MKDPVTGKLWMSYSAVNPSPTWGPTQNKVSVHTRLAFSLDQGETWTDAGGVNQIKDVTIPLAAPNNAGTWMNEVSTLVYDPGAALGQRWKIFYHTFLKINSGAHFDHSWIAYQAASTPEGLASAPPIKLFTSYAYNSASDNPVGFTSTPLSGPAAIQLDTAIHPDMNNCILAEPGIYATASALYMAIQCEKFGTTTIIDRMIFLLKCNSPCNVTNAASWAYLGRLFNRAEATAAQPAFAGGYAAPALVKTPTGIYLVVTPTVEPDAIYRGCSVFKFANLDTAELVKSSGVPTLIASTGNTSKFNGACGYTGDATASGMLRSELSDLSLDGEFQIFMDRIHF